MAKILCEAPGCRSPRANGPEHARLAVPGLRLCVVCRDQVERTLAELPMLHAHCERALVRQSRWLTERVGGTRPNGISLNDAAVAARTDLVDVPASWAALVVDERRVRPPRSGEIRELVRFLGIHLDWLCGHAAAADFAEELADLAQQAREVLDPNPMVRMELGPCQVSGCTEVVHAIVRAADEERPEQVRCGAGHSWGPHQWLLLAGRLENAKQTLAAARAGALEEAA